MKKPSNFDELVAYLDRHAGVTSEGRKLAFISTDAAKHLHFTDMDGKRSHTPAGGPCGPGGHKPDLTFTDEGFSILLFGKAIFYEYDGLDDERMFDEEDVYPEYYEPGECDP